MAEEQQQQPMLRATARDLRYFASLMRGINFSNRALIELDSSGFVVTVEEARSFIGRAYVFSTVFDAYSFIPPQIDPNPESDDDEDPEEAEYQRNREKSFEFQLTTLIDCLNVFGNATSFPTGGPTKRRVKGWKNLEDEQDDDDGEDGVERKLDKFLASTKGAKGVAGMRIGYIGPGHPLSLMIAEDATGPTATCEITTYEPEIVPQFDFDDNDSDITKFILKSSWLHDALSELHPSCEKITFVANPAPSTDTSNRNGRGSKVRSDTVPRLQLKADGTFGSTEMDYPNDREVLEYCQCDRRISFTYKASQIQHTIKALQSSTKTSLRINSEGVLAMQLMMPGPNTKEEKSFIDFKCLPIDTE
ncbi:Rad1-domain-containing protein [Abortiporus biennis]|nr:Rad1-domain-containing protein [Abortiporus biennis]